MQGAQQVGGLQHRAPSLWVLGEIIPAEPAPGGPVSDAEVGREQRGHGKQDGGEGWSEHGSALLPGQVARPGLAATLRPGTSPGVCVERA